MNRTIPGLAAGAALVLLGTAAAQQTGVPHGQHDQMPGATSSTASSRAEQAYRAAAARMHHNMEIRYTGDPDKDFAAAMIPHHQAAIDMAQVVLKYGKDPAIRALAEAVIREQAREIAELRAWQQKAR